MKNLITVIFVLLTIVGCNSASHKNILLRIKYRKYEKIDIKYRKYLYEVDSPEDPQNNEYIRMGFTVDSLTKDSSFIFSAGIDYIRSQRGSPIRLNYASDEDEAQMGSEERSLHDMLKPILNAKYTFTLGHHGQILKPFSLKNGPTVEFGAILMDLSLFQINFPEEKIGIEDEWTDEMVLSEKKNIRRKMTYHIQHVYDDTIEIFANGEQREGGTSENIYGTFTISRKFHTLMSAKIETGEGSSKAVVSIEAH